MSLLNRKNWKLLVYDFTTYHNVNAVARGYQELTIFRWKYD